MKIKTSIIETLACLFKVFAISLLFLSFTNNTIYKAIIAIVLWIASYFLNKWELTIESKRDCIIKKHYDYTIMKVFAWIALVGVLFSLGIYSRIQNKPDEYYIRQMGDIAICIYLFIASSKRKLLYKKQEESEKDIESHP